MRSDARVPAKARYAFIPVLLLGVVACNPTRTSDDDLVRVLTGNGPTDEGDAARLDAQLADTGQPTDTQPETSMLDAVPADVERAGDAGVVRDGGDRDASPPDTASADARAGDAVAVRDGGNSDALRPDTASIDARAGDAVAVRDGGDSDTLPPNTASTDARPADAARDSAGDGGEPECVSGEADERCDGLDNDCDGATDEDLTRPCQTACGEGTEYCRAGEWRDCDATQPVAESCDGLDNDCDGHIDAVSCYEGPPDTQQVGACRSGVRTCDNGEWRECVGQVLPRVDVADNGVDEDCNGRDACPDRDGDGYCEHLVDCDPGPVWCDPETDEICPGPIRCDRDTPDNCRGLANLGQGDGDGDGAGDACDGDESMIFVPGGCFQLDRADDGQPGANPRQSFEVCLGPFWIDKFEVTNEQYAACEDAGGCRPPLSSRFEMSGGGDDSEYYRAAEKPTHPVIHVTWAGAQAYCEWRGASRGDRVHRYGLPTEIQWEVAARGHDLRPYPWGTAEPTCDNANFWPDTGNPLDGPCNDGPRAVGTFGGGRSPYGVYDMAGNVWEWTRDCFWSLAYDQHALTCVNCCARGQVCDPVIDDGHQNCAGAHVQRGGSWWTTAEQLQSHYRQSVAGDDERILTSQNDHGFRCARSLRAD